MRRLFVGLACLLSLSAAAQSSNFYGPTIPAGGGGGAGTDTNAVHQTGNETAAGNKTWSGAARFNSTVGFNVTPGASASNYASQIDDNTVQAWWFDGFSGGATTPTNGITFRSARGTPGTPTAVQLDDEMTFLSVRGHDGTGFASGSRGGISIRAAQNWSAGNHGTKIVLRTTPTGATAAADAVTIGADKSLTAVGALAGSNLSGTNTGDVSITTINGTSTANGASCSGQTCRLHAADANNGGAQSSANFTKTNGLTHERWIYPPDYTNANTALTVVAGRVWLRMVHIRVRGPVAGVGVMTPQAGTLAGSATVGVYGPVTNTTPFTCAGASLVASSADTSQTTGTPVALGHGWTIAFSSTPTVEPGLYCIALQTNTGVLLTRGSNFWGMEDGMESRFTTDQASGTTALPSTVPALTHTNSDVPAMALKMQ